MDDRLKIAKACWKQIKEDLEDRSMMDIGSIDDETAEELQEQQISYIDKALSDWAKHVSPYRTRD